LSKLARSRIKQKGVEPGAYDGGAVAKLHHIDAEANPYDEILQHLQSITPALSSGGLSESRG
jgi:hypothetical protein